MPIAQFTDHPETCTGKSYTTKERAHKAMEELACYMAGDIRYYLHPITVDGKLRYRPVVFWSKVEQDRIVAAWKGFAAM